MTRTQLIVQQTIAQMAEIPSRLDPNQTTRAPVYLVIMGAEHGETTIETRIQTRDQRTFDRYQIGQTVEVSMYPRGLTILDDREDDPDLEVLAGGIETVAETEG